jgi:hypothetical protein
MNKIVYYCFIYLLVALTTCPCLPGYGSSAKSPSKPYPLTSPKTKPGRVPSMARYDKTLRFNVYTFSVSAADSASVRQMTIKAYRGKLLLTNFKVQLNGTVTNAEVADLDKNGFPELYIYSTNENSLGRVHAWQFLTERKAAITPVNWPLATDKAYMGQDSLWIDRASLCRKYPAYQVVKGKKVATGGTHWVRYRLRPIGSSFALVAEPKF